MKKTKNTIRFFEEIASNGHVALKSLLYDGWILRFSNGYTNRANSVLPLYPSKKSLEEKVAYCEKAYEKEDLSPCFKLTEYDQELSDFLADRGYKMTGASDIMLLKKLNSIADKKLYRSCMLAKSAYLQVLQTNEAAKNLYKKLGFEKLYSYWYMKK